MWNILIASFLSGMSSPVGAWLALRFGRVTHKQLAFFLGLAGGIMITVILTELSPASIQSGGRSLFFIGVTLGWLSMWVLGKVTSKFATHPHSTEIQAENFLRIGWFIAIALAIHDLPEGLAIGAADAIHPKIGLLIALVIALHNIPEGMSIALPLYLGGIPKRKVLWITFWIGWVTPLGTLLALALLHISTLFISLSLAFACGTMAFVVAVEILPEAFHAQWRYSGYGLLSGAVVMSLASMLHP